MVRLTARRACRHSSFIVKKTLDITHEEDAPETKETVHQFEDDQGVGITVFSKVGDNIRQCAINAYSMARHAATNVRLNFNNVNIIVHPSDTVEEIVRNYFRNFDFEL